LLDYIQDSEIPVGALGQLLALAQKKSPKLYTEYKEGIKLELDRLEPAVPELEEDIESVPSSNLLTLPDEAEQLQKRIVQKTRVLYELQLQEAQYGLATPPHIKIQLEDLQKEIDELKQKLNVLS
jgi:hypothetical protein